MRALLLVMVAGIAAVALTTLPASAQRGFSGQSDYQVFCSSCHGDSAKGDGVIAKSLPKHPPDLTQLSARNEAVYPAERVFKVIEGRTGSHGGADMPAWGDVFEKAQESQGPEATKARIDALVDYLKSLQDK